MDTRRKAWISRSAYGLIAVLPSAELREILIRNERRKVATGVSKYINLDYSVKWLAADGYGVQLGAVPPNPPKPYRLQRNPAIELYKNPGYDLVNM